MLHLVYDPVLNTGTIYVSEEKFYAELDRIDRESTYPGWVDSASFETDAELESYLDKNAYDGCIAYVS